MRLRTSDAQPVLRACVPPAQPSREPSGKASLGEAHQAVTAGPASTHKLGNPMTREALSLFWDVKHFIWDSGLKPAGLDRVS
jgi:hypothetical protein